ncbi:hypothetical protein [Thalassobacillus sp. B23F22_16]|uniref:hypothetical protein n=1 Tax=Thalassobacillus sp. B23F22_16 TaxID=3459513 RepID=UPI00373F848D
MNNNFTPSSRVDNIFYGDIFEINDKVCLVFGYGKSEACRIASNNDENKQIGVDHACITTDNKGNAYGHYEVNIRGRKVDDPIKERRKIDCLLRMLDQEETQKLINDNPFLKEKLSIIEIPFEAFIRFSDFNITFTAESLMPTIADGVPITEQNPDKRRRNFLKLTQDAKLPCLIVPWAETVEEKAEIMKRDLHSDQ